MNIYLDSSVLLRLILGEPEQISEWRHWERVVSSRLIEVECLRVLDRLRLQRGLSETEIRIRREALFEFLEAVTLVEFSRAILRRASDPFPVMVGTLDAIHLATALAYQDEADSDLVMVTHDRALGQASLSSGLKVIGI